MSREVPDAVTRSRPADPTGIEADDSEPARDRIKCDHEPDWRRFKIVA